MPVQAVQLLTTILQSVQLLVQASAIPELLIYPSGTQDKQVLLSVKYT